MRNILKKDKGITLIALVITIIILLILAGISIASLTGSGLFEKAKESKEKSEQAQIKEEIEMAIMDIQIEEIAKGNDVTLESLANGQLENKLEGIIATLNDNEINGEYKGYEYTIDDNLKVTIGDTLKGISFYYTLTPKGYTNGNITLTVNAKSTNGNITNIEVNGLTQNADGTFTITQNGEYQVTVTDSTGETKTKPLNIQEIDKVAPTKAEVTIEDVKTNGFTIKAKAEDSHSGIDRYEYYIIDKSLASGATKDDYLKYETVNDEYKITGLEQSVNYIIYVVVYDKANNYSYTDPIEVVTKSNKLDYPILTLNGIMNCIDEDGNYYYDKDVSTDGLYGFNIKAYDKDDLTYDTVGGGSKEAGRRISVSPECWGKYLSILMERNATYNYSSNEIGEEWGGTDLGSGYFGSGVTSKTILSNLIPEGTKSVLITSGGRGNYGYIYEIWVSNEDLSGSTDLPTNN